MPIAINNNLLVYMGLMCGQGASYGFSGCSFHALLASFCNTFVKNYGRGYAGVCIIYVENVCQMVG